MENELTIYRTPAQDTPYATPISTPRRVPYRMNPVKMIRQHVPVKILSSEEGKIASPDSVNCSAPGGCPSRIAEACEQYHSRRIWRFDNSMSTSHSMNPMKTKRVKCTIQPTPIVNDGIGDQIINHLAEDRSVYQSHSNSLGDHRDELLSRITRESLPPLEGPGKLSSHDDKSRAFCHSRGDAETIESNFSSQVAEGGSNMAQQPANEVVVPVNVPSALHMSGEVKKESTSSVRKSPEESIISYHEFNEEIPPDSHQFMGQDMINGSRLRSANEERRESRLQESLETKKEIEITQKILNVAASSFHENPVDDEKSKTATKTAIPPEKAKRALQQKRPIQSQDNTASGTHKCDKKKFYDPTDIRKYMIKKKCERQAKEKEEKSKKANELAALKRKTEITKMFAHRSRIPLSNNPSRDNNLVKEIPDTAKPTKKIGPTSVKSHARSQPYETEALCYYKKTQKPVKTEVPAKRSHEVNSKSKQAFADPKVAKLDDFCGIDETDKYFQKRFNDIISICAKEASKIVNAEFQSTTEGDDLKYLKDSKLTGASAASTGEPLHTLSSSLEELKFKNPYNFLNILKGKVNLAQDGQRFHDQNNELMVTPAKQMPAQHHLEERMANGDKRRISDETYIMKHLKPELSLSDLNLSAKKRHETYRSSCERLSSHTFVVPEFEARRKPTKSSKRVESKENLDSSLGISGVQPLPPFKPFVSTPLTEKNNIPRILEFSESKKGMVVNDNRVSLGRTYTSEKLSEPLHDDTRAAVQESDSLKVTNASFLLPESAQLRASTDCDINQSKLLSVDKFDSLFNPDLTLTNILIDEADSKVGDDLNLSQELSHETPPMNSSFVLVELYDQMIKSEDEKLLQILKKIQQQKEALNKYLRSEVFALEIQKNEYRDNKDEEKIKTIKKKQRGILLKVTKSILDLDKMKKSVIETVEKRKADLLKQKISMKQKKVVPKQRSPLSKPHGRLSDPNNRTFLITKQMKTFFGISSSSCTSILVENGREVKANTVERNEQFNNEISDCIQHENNVMVSSPKQKCDSLKDTATSPIPFNGGISIRLDLDPEKLAKLKNSFAEIQIHPLKSPETNALMDANGSQISQTDEQAAFMKDSSNLLETSHSQEPKSVKIKRPLSPVILPPSKKILQIRRMSSGSDATVPSLNDTTTTDQSDIELRISALQEQLRQRKLEAEKLRREEKQLRKEKLRSKEQSLLKQLEAYDEYIKKVSKMLTENVNTEVKKPLIKQAPHFKPSPNDSSLYEQPSFVERSPLLAARAKKSTQNDEKILDEGETNTEDSEKQLRKADSGILIESEVTEPSETTDFKSRLEPLETLQPSSEQKPSQIRAVQLQSGTDVEPPVESSAKGSKSLLRMINDLHSEVHSLSEQLYSSDFVEDIPEDIADAKSEVSEAVTNDNTSMSIEEILSDHRSEPSDVTPSREPATPKSQIEELSEEKTPSAGSRADSISEPEIAESSSINASDPQSEFNICVQTIENLESTGSEVVPEEQILAKEPASDQDVPKMQPFSIDNAKNDTFSGSAEFDFYNVKNISDIESLADLESGNQNQWLSEEVPENHSALEEIKSASSIENLSEESKVTSRFEPSDFESKTSPELIKLDYVNESEGSNVADVNEPVEVLGEVTTMMDALSVSEISEPDPENIIPINQADSAKVAADAFQKAEDLPQITIDRSSPKGVTPVPEELRDARVSILDNFEETDISESLEYDAIPLGSPNKTIPSILDDGFGRSSFEGIQSELLLNVPSTRSTPGEVSHEKDRSVEEHLVEDFSIPNLMESTFLVHNNSSSLNLSEEQQAGSVSLSVVQEVVSEQLEAAVSDANLEQITENQTPFLQALKREQENLIARQHESVDKITVDLFESLIEETCTSLVNTMSRKMRSCDFGLSPTCDQLDVNDIPEISDKVDESSDKNKAAGEFDESWYEKRLNLDQERLREAEELRLQQLKIEQEIEELQAQQQIPPYIYLREIPNKPPPPYTPPADQSTKIPANEVELQVFASSTIESVCEQLHRGTDIDAIKELPEARSSKKSKSDREVRTYKRFMFDLTKEIAKGIVEATKKCECHPWEEPSRQKVAKPLPGREELQKMIENEIQVLFGFQSKISKEKLIIQWSRKRKSDFVDDLLIQELQEEEGEWTNYEEDELIIKNQITESLLDDLVEDTILCLTEAFQKKGY